MKLFPESAVAQLEFEKIRTLLEVHCKTEYARLKARDLRIHTRLAFIELELRQTHEYKQLLQNSVYFPNDFILNLSKDLKLLGIPGAVMTGEQLVHIRKLSENIQSIFRWFDNERRLAYSGMAKVIDGTYY